MKFIYDEIKIKDNIREMFSAISYGDIVSGELWYKSANQWCNEIAEENNTQLIKICGITSVMSPMVSWKQNKEYVKAFMKRRKKHTTIQHNKAKRINNTSDYNEIYNIIGGMKTQAFFDCIYNHKTSRRVVCDRHMITISGQPTKDITTCQYKFLEKCYIDVANENNILPSTFQCILWNHYRNSNNLNEKYG